MLKDLIGKYIIKRRCIKRTDVVLPNQFDSCCMIPAIFFEQRFGLRKHNRVYIDTVGIYTFT